MIPVDCTAALNIRGEHFPCDMDVMPHHGLAHTNKDAQAIWCDRVEDGRTVDAVWELTEAIRLTQEYIGLPVWPGWSWYDALAKYRPELDLEHIHTGP